MDYKELGNRVREARTIYGITQSNLAERVGCSVQHISHIETGHTKASLPLLVKIANTLHVSVDYLLQDSLEENSSELSISIEVRSEKEKAIRRFLRIRNDQNAQLKIKEDGIQRVVDIKDIFYIEKRRNYSYIYLKDHRCVKVRKNLRDYEFELAGKGLVRVHAGYMVAMKYCAKIEKGQIVMEDGTEIPISRDRKNMVKEQFMISRRK